MGIKRNKLEHKRETKKHGDGLARGDAKLASDTFERDMDVKKYNPLNVKVVLVGC